MITVDPKPLSLEALLEEIQEHDVYLYLTKRWMDWAGAVSTEAQIMAVNPEGKSGQLLVSLSHGQFGNEKLDYDSRMKFIVKKKAK